MFPRWRLDKTVTGRTAYVTCAIAPTSLVPVFATVALFLSVKLDENICLIVVAKFENVGMQKSCPSLVKSVCVYARGSGHVGNLGTSLPRQQRCFARATRALSHHPCLMRERTRRRGRQRRQRGLHGGGHIYFCPLCCLFSLSHHRRGAIFLPPSPSPLPPTMAKQKKKQLD